MNIQGLNLKRRGANTGNIVRDTLMNHGVEDFDKYRDVSGVDLPFTDPKNLHNMDKAFARLEEAFDKDELIGILVDGDADGFASAAMLYRGIMDMNPDARLELIIPEHKSHGLETMTEEILWRSFDLVFVPDAGSNDIEQHKALHNSKIDVIVLDHHIINEESLQTPAIVVNNQIALNGSVNKNFVGAGMVFMFMKYVAENTSYKPDIELTDYLPLMAFGQITDVSDVAEQEIRYYVQKGLELFGTHKFLKIFNEFESSVHMVSFKIAPLVNAVARIGTLAERKNLLLALSSELSTDTVEVTKRRKNYATGLMEPRVFNLNEYQIEYDSLAKVKKRQDDTVKKALNNIDYISHKDDGVVIAKIPEDVSKSITGLIAGKIMSITQAPVFVVKEHDGVLSGSMRCPTPFELRSWINSTGVATSSGHEQASGVEFKVADIQKLLTKTRNELDIAQDFIVVDGLYDEYNTSQAPVRLINDSIALFGGSVKEPELGFKSLPIKKANINNYGNVVKFNFNGLNFVIFSGSELIDCVQNQTGFNTKINLDIIGVASKNDWGDKSPQVVVRDYAITTEKTALPERAEDFIF